jgi:hypothetical protein
MKTPVSFKYPFAALLVQFAVVSLHAAAPATDFKFQFGVNQAAPGCTLVSPTRTYSKDIGYGFEPGASVTAVAGAITAAQPFMFSVAVPEGNYRVTVTLGDPTADAVTTVKAESRRLMLEIRDAHFYRQCPHSKNFQR